MSNLIDIGITIRSEQDNPWFERLMASLRAKAAGLPHGILVEQGQLLTKVEKRLRLFRRSQARYLAILEDDTEVLHDGWLLNLVSRMGVHPDTAVMNPAETRHPPEDVPPAELRDETVEITNAAGFCMLIDRESGIEPDARVRTMDDLWLSLAARARGWRVVSCAAAIVRHSKLPWGSDDLAPWEMADRSRFGDGDAYYDRDRHEAKRRNEAKLMVETFGDLARLTLPKELLDERTDPLLGAQERAAERRSGIAYVAERLAPRLAAARATGGED